MKKIGIILILGLTMFATGCGCEQKKDKNIQDDGQIDTIKTEIQADVIQPLTDAIKDKQVDKIVDTVSEESDYYELVNNIVENTDPMMTKDMYQAYLQTRTQDEYKIEQVDDQYYLSFTGETINLLSMMSNGGYTDLASFQTLLAQQPKNKGGVLIRLVEENGNWEIDPSDVNYGIVLFGGIVVQ